MVLSRAGLCSLALAYLFTASALCGTALADDDNEPKADGSFYTLLNPVPTNILRDYNPDRPSKITSPFTIDAGHLEIESDFASFQNSHSSGVRQDALQLLDPTIKLGLLSNVDVEFGLNGFEVVHSTGSRTLSGFGDVNIRVKVNVVGNDGGDFALAVVPYVKLPSDTQASLAIGNDAVEGGGMLTAQLKLPQNFQLGLQTEVDALQGGKDTARYANFVNIATLSHEIPGVKNLTGYAEFYSSVSEDKYTPNIYTADFALAYLVGKNTQLDGGLNVGLNKGAPEYQLYTGVSQRF